MATLGGNLFKLLLLLLCVSHCSQSLMESDMIIPATSQDTPDRSPDHVIPGDGHVISSDYVDFHVGSPTSNIVMSVPHDGDIEHPSIPHRLQGCYNSSSETCDWRHDSCDRAAETGFDVTKCRIVGHADARAAQLGLVMRETIAEITGHAPHLIISRLHRSRLDPNRDRDNAAQHNPIAERSYDRFHGMIQQAHDKVKMTGLPGVHFDVHGYTLHNIDNWLELGYNIRGDQLNEGDLNPADSSIQALGGRTTIPFEDLVSGYASLGWEVQQEGYRVVPSPQYPRPELGVEGRYFRGGFITRKWGSLNGGNIDCVQLEVPQWVRDESDVHGVKLGRAFAKWVQTHYPNRA